MKRFFLICMAALPILYAQDVYLVSYPRCGTNWTMYMLQCLTGCQWQTTALRSFNGLDVNPNVKPFRRSHHLYNNVLYSNTNQKMFVADPKNDKLILLLRNYKECLLRHFYGNVKQVKQAIKSRNHGGGVFNVNAWYFDNIYAFDQWDQPNRLLIFYEDLMSSEGTQHTVEKLVEFLGSDVTTSQKFLNSLDWHRKNSLNQYSYGSTVSQGADLKYHSKKVSKAILQDIDLLVESHHPTIWKEYLKRYKE